LMWCSLVSFTIVPGEEKLETFLINDCILVTAYRMFSGNTRAI